MWDLDDTLILERDYVRSGFRAVAERIADATGSESGEITDFLWNGFEKGVRGNAFNRLHEHFPVTRTVTVPEMVDTYRTHDPSIEIPEEALNLMRRIREQGRHQAAITDGPLAGQRSKAAAVDLASLVELIVFTDEWGRNFWKPHQRAFLSVQEHFGLDAPDCVYIGDNPSKDFVSPNALGWGTIRLRRTGQLHADVEEGTPALYEVRSWTELSQLIGQRKGNV